MMFIFQIYSADVNLAAFLDHEIWKSSYLLAQEIPGPQHVHKDDHGLVDFGPDWNQVECAIELDSDVKKTEIDQLENHIKIVIEQ